LTGNDRGTKNDTTAVARQRPVRQSIGWKAVFSVESTLIAAQSTLIAAHATMDTTMRSDVFYAVRSKDYKRDKV
jgi:hypothetical protein